MLKGVVKEFIGNVFGFRIMNNDHLPIGLELESDIKTKLNFHPKLIFDVGANIGQTAQRYQAQFPGASIYSFEPVTGSYDQLVKNTAALPEVKTFHFALGNKRDQQEIKLFSADRSVLNSLLENSELMDKNAQTETIHIERADDFCTEHHIQQIDLLKIDTEGYEMEVLRGADKMISEKKVKLIYCECGFSAHNRYKVYFPEILEYLVEKGYILFSFYEMGSYESIDKNVKGGSQYGNALFFLP